MTKTRMARVREATKSAVAAAAKPIIRHALRPRLRHSVSQLFGQMPDGLLNANRAESFIAFTQSRKLSDAAASDGRSSR